MLLSQVVLLPREAAGADEGAGSSRDVLAVLAALLDGFLASLSEATDVEPILLADLG